MDDNISVDSFSQDAIFDSGRSVARFYFTPDMITARDDDGNENKIVVTKSNNPDVQKNYKIQIYHRNQVEIQGKLIALLRSYQ